MTHRTSMFSAHHISTWLLTAVIMCGACPSAYADEEEVQLWRLDCGTMDIEDISYFSDAHAYDGQSAHISNGCYLVRHGEQYLLWDAGLSLDYLGNTEADDGWTSSVSRSIASQLAELDLKPGDIDVLGISHFHGDHIGQAAEFSNATLLLALADEQWLRNRPPGNAWRRLSDWFDGPREMSTFSGDLDVFGDGRVVILATPGHTPGHSALLVRLGQSGPVLLSGDLFHFRSEIGQRNVSRWNTSRADTLASIERFEALILALNPTVIVQHDCGDVARLPAFPASAQ